MVCYSNELKKMCVWVVGVMSVIISILGIATIGYGIVLMGVVGKPFPDYIKMGDID